MYNKEIIDELIHRFGIESTILFCKMESVKNELLWEDCKNKKIAPGECVEFDFERDWWKSEGELLLTELPK